MDSREIRERLLSIQPTPGSPWGEQSARRQSPGQVLQQLLAMGFPPIQCERAIAYSGSERVEDVLNFLLEGDRGWEHPFLPREDDESLCLFCNDLQHKHVSEVPPPPTWTEERSNSRPVSGAIACYQKQTDICGICYEEVTAPWSLPKDQHSHVYCKGCAVEYVNSLVVDGKVDKIVCPGVTCGLVFQENDLKGLIDANMYEKYHRFKLRNDLLKDPTLRWCSEPNCPGYMHGSPSSPQMTCPVCASVHCFLCGSKWHSGQSCDQVQDQEYKAWASQHEIQLCPQCKRPVEKNAGCNHMTCVCCHYEFCWLCRQHYTGSHFNPLNPFGCAGLQGSDNEKRNWPKWRIYARRAWILLLWVLLVVFFPVVVCLCPAFYVAAYVVERSMDRSRCGRYCLVACTFLIAAVLTPVAVALLVPMLLVFVMYKCCRCIREIC